MISACWTLPDHVDRAAERWPDTEALVWPDERLTFAEFAARTRAFAHGAARARASRRATGRRS